MIVFAILAYLLIGYVIWALLDAGSGTSARIAAHRRANGLPATAVQMVLGHAWLIVWWPWAVKVRLQQGGWQRVRRWWVGRREA